MEALLEMKKKNTKCATKCSQYNVIMTVIDKFQQLNVHPLYFLLLAWAAFPGYGNVCFAFPVPCWAIPLERWQCLFIFSLCVIALCMMYVYLYMLVYGLSCTLYDGLSWLHEWPSLAMSALDLVVCVCAQGICCRSVLTLYCVHNHHGMTVPIHVTKWHWFPQYAWCSEGLWLVLTQTCWHAPYTLAWNPANVP